jgi:hypothetical protein
MPPDLSPISPPTRPSGAIAILRQLLVEAAVSACNIAIHALVTTAVARVAQRATVKETLRQSQRLIAVMNGVLLLGGSTAVIFGVLRRRVRPRPQLR